MFLAGYGAAQALPGPLFTVAAFFGTIASVGPRGALGAAIATIAIFLPGLLLVCRLPALLAGDPPPSADRRHLERR